MVEKNLLNFSITTLQTYELTLSNITVMFNHQIVGIFDLYPLTSKTIILYANKMCFENVYDPTWHFHHLVPVSRMQ